MTREPAPQPSALTHEQTARKEAVDAAGRVLRTTFNPFASAPPSANSVAALADYILTGNYTPPVPPVDAVAEVLAPE